MPRTIRTRDNSQQSPLENIFLNGAQSIDTLTINLTAGPNQSWSLGADDATTAFTLSANLSSFQFTGYGPGATEFSLTGGYYEIVPAAVPESSTYLAAILAVKVVGYHQWRRWRRRRSENSGTAVTDSELAS
jgi:hypothetical protein